MAIQRLDALTFATHEMRAAVAFYESLGGTLAYGGPDGEFTTLHFDGIHLNLVLAGEEARWGWWGRAVFWVDDVDAFYAHCLAEGHTPEAAPRDAEWGERYFHIRDPDGHELSFAQPLRRRC
jgi:catechol 2,3-dioxygenase-like lactoylglutathione lyase family enzyme